ncbi:hydroxyacid dehydrogenase [Candidatus Wolfebacteria bacterium RIFOXYD12_FULL_48_21]|uniref:Hydroxyacid dehydrogenase n=1 Tax=Candidatus Wolfebacteria bacterium RIFOXYD1_FULL_48_65 TaxID=1802561 RepID=A0A1F8E3M3_9BACT|nr:MAG: hydroxyacid dehydrogenase [Candidatus Wolfebacteria bacterium RIFOXYD12_FULL_48_21]OGM95441.1 MAG: hydroxyacid dehydrogenase [Candidatus Wolfebacteria bacterium RIFOXYD1_FULL_48_65]OGM97142.1 MAG: hydroxyacid dehydrogenase [Candidatus Wolfebacteria bacterium RIFOXYD2_FULL_48_11]
MEKLPKSQMVIYQAGNGETKIDVRFDGTTVWLTMEQMALLFDKAKSTINEHVLNIYKEGELEKTPTTKKIGNSDFLEKPTNYYNLDVIISVGYRVKSVQGTYFRKWATKRLGEYIVKGFVMDDERLKNPDVPFDYFEELTRRIADIRTSEKRFYRKITDIYATSVDYDPTDEQSILFFKTVQNKVHYAITGSTAAEIVANRVDSKKPNIGLTSWRGDKPTKEEVIIAKNYLNGSELLALNNLVEQYLVFAEGQALRRVPMHMKDWIEKLHGFLKLNDRDILRDAGKISHEIAVEIAEKHFDAYKKEEADKDLGFDEAALLALESAKSRKMKRVSSDTAKPKKKR